jgi:hypothetical protein
MQPQQLNQSHCDADAYILLAGLSQTQFRQRTTGESKSNAAEKWSRNRDVNVSQ